MLSGRIYRAAAAPLPLVLAIAGLSLANRPPALSPGLAPPAFDGTWTMQELRALEREYPQRRPGSRGDRELAQTVARTIEGLGGLAAGGFRVSVRRLSGNTIDGARALVSVVAERPGATNESPIVVLAHRDAAAGPDAAELSGTAALLELARALSNVKTNRTIVLVSTSGGSGGDAGAADLASVLDGGQVPWSSATAGNGAGRGADAAIVLGDLASARVRQPVVIPYSDGLGGAPAELVETAAGAVGQLAGIKPGAPGVVDQLMHLASPLTLGEQGPLNAAGFPAVLIQASGEAGPPVGAEVSQARIEGLGSAVLTTIAALDASPGEVSAPRAEISLAHELVPGWAVRLLVAALLLPALVGTFDALARVRRRGEAVGTWLGFTLLCGLPFLACAWFVAAMAALGLAGAAPGLAVPVGVGGVGAPAQVTTVLAGLLFVLAWLVWRRMVRVVGADWRAQSPAAGVGMLVVLDLTALVTWVVNPFAALLLVPAVHLWMVVASPGLRSGRRALTLAMVALGLCGPGLVLLYYALAMGGGPLGAVWVAMVLLAGAHMGIGVAVLWSLWLGCMVAAALMALSSPRAKVVPVAQRAITIRGPISYAGPGSLGGTESTLRR